MATMLQLGERRAHVRRPRAPSEPILLCRLASGDDELDIPIDIEIVAASTPNLPVNFRERLALALRTTDAQLLDAAERAYQGTWPTLKGFLLDRLGRALGTSRAAFLAKREAVDLLRFHQDRGFLIWSIPVPGPARMVFELTRGSPEFAALAPLIAPQGTACRGP